MKVITPSKPYLRVNISGAHGSGKTQFARAFAYGYSGNCDILIPDSRVFCKKLCFMEDYDEREHELEGTYLEALNDWYQDNIVDAYKNSYPDCVIFLGLSEIYQKVLHETYQRFGDIPKFNIWSQVKEYFESIQDIIYDVSRYSTVICVFNEKKEYSIDGENTIANTGYIRDYDQRAVIHGDIDMRVIEQKGVEVTWSRMYWMPKEFHDVHSGIGRFVRCGIENL